MWLNNVFGVNERCIIEFKWWDFDWFMLVVIWKWFKFLRNKVVNGRKCKLKLKKIVFWVNKVVVSFFFEREV